MYTLYASIWNYIRNITDRGALDKIELSYEESTENGNETEAEAHDPEDLKYMEMALREAEQSQDKDVQVY